MFGEKHDLLHELPEHKERIHDLKLSNKHFSRLFDQYHKIDHEVGRIAQGVETPSDEYTENLKKQRLSLKDELLAMIKA